MAVRTQSVDIAPSRCKLHPTLQHSTHLERTTRLFWGLAASPSYTVHLTSPSSASGTALKLPILATRLYSSRTIFSMQFPPTSTYRMFSWPICASHSSGCGP